MVMRNAQRENFEATVASCSLQITYPYAILNFQFSNFIHTSKECYVIERNA